MQLLTSYLRLGTLLAAIALLLSAALPTQAQGEMPPPPALHDPRFGIVASYDSPDVATAAGVGWSRVLFWWHQVERDGPGTWNPFYFPDSQLARERADGRQLVGLLAGTPPWASASGSPRAVPDGLFLPFDDPNNHWGRFVGAMAARYRGQIDHWIVWNEPDVWDDTHPGKTWDGTVEEYARLLTVAYQAAHAANPDALIHLSATTYWWDVEHGRDLYLGRLLRALRADPEASALGGSFDVASLHLYFKPEQVHDVTRLYRRLLDEQGFGAKPLWINETNAPPSTDPLHPAPGLRFAVTLEEQSAFVVQAWAMGLAGGAERLALYKTRDEPTLLPGVEPYGLQRLDGSLRPAFWSYRVLVSYLSGYEQARLSREEEVRRVVIERGAWGRTTVLWNAGTTATRLVRVPALHSEALLVDPFGPVERLHAQGGAYTLRLAPGSGNGIGGWPLLLVEGAGGAVPLERPSHLAPPPVPPLPPTGQAEWPLPTGCFFTQAAQGQGGFSVTDDATARFWSEFQRLGGLQTVGYPISRRFLYDGFVTQAFQKLVLQWRPEVGQAWPVNVFDELSRQGFDEPLWHHRQTPRPLVAYDSAEEAWPQIVARRQALLDANPAIRARYFAAPDALTVFGLPVSAVEDMGNHVALRTQRAVFQQWKEAMPWAAPGQVTIANGGDIAKELGWLPAEALRAESR